MKITKITIHGFRQYKDLKVEFNSADKDEHDLHIIIAKNGIGKTNLLNAIEWCLYDDEPHLGNPEEALKRINNTLFDEAIALGEKEVTLSVELLIDHGNEKVKIKREQTFSTKTAFGFTSVLMVTVMKKDNSDIIKDGEAMEYVNGLFKKEIREYFFFDGE